MVALLPRTQIDSYHIDSIERAIVFSALALRKEIVGGENDNAENKNLTIEFNTLKDDESFIEIDVSLPFNSYNFHKQGGKIINNLQEFPASPNTIDAPGFLNYIGLPSVPIEPIIPDYNENLIDTFEKYLFYYTSILWLSVAEKKRDVVRFDIKGSKFGGSIIRLQITLPFDFKKWIFNKSLIETVKRVVDTYATDTDIANLLFQSIDISDDSLLGNNQLYGN